jgi:hypothetical protein
MYTREYKQKMHLTPMPVVIFEKQAQINRQRYMLVVSYTYVLLMLLQYTLYFLVRKHTDTHMLLQYLLYFLTHLHTQTHTNTHASSTCCIL